jgi:hypothetical protein
MLHCDKLMLQRNDKLPRGRLPHDNAYDSIGFLERRRTPANAHFACR